MHTKKLQNERQRGFSLIELMVGMVLAMIAVIVVMQIFQQSERNKRTTTGSASASMDGAIAFTDLQRDLRQGGMGSSNLAELGCGLTIPATGITIANLGPVTVNHPKVAKGDANTDTLLIIYGSGNASPEGDRVTAHSSDTAYSVNTPTAFKVNAADATKNPFVVAAMQKEPAPCTLVLDQLVSVAGTAPGGTVNTKTGSSTTADTLYDWGQPTAVAYRVYAGRLQQCNYLTADCNTTTTGVWTDLVDGVVSLRALYGRDTTGNMDGVIDVYDQTSPASACGWARTAAVQVALTVRSGQLETGAVTGSAAASAPLPTWSGSATAPIDVTATNGNWASYRYRVYESVVSMRNMSWIGAQNSCNGIF